MINCFGFRYGKVKRCRTCRVKKSCRIRTAENKKKGMWL